jgi:lipopolysaccharide/colanic/teichoic acid biosynthesis glycosyltransferase
VNVPASIRLELAIKRTIDVVAAAGALVLASPLLVGIAVAIKVEDPQNPLFFNDRVTGRGESPFRMLKFRSMVPHDRLH